MHRPSPMRGLIVVGMASLVIALAVAVLSSQTTDFCSSCHEMNKPYRGWQLSEHSHVGCLTCHSDSGMMGYLKSKVRGLMELWRFYLGGADGPLESRVEPRVCLRCHEEEVAPGGDGATGWFKHRLHLTIYEGDCISCHGRVVHRARKELGETELGHQDCQPCHAPLLDDESQCGNCHKD